MQKRFMYAFMALIIVVMSNVYASTGDSTAGQLTKLHDVLNVILGDFDSAGKYKNGGSTPLQIQQQYKSTLDQYKKLLGAMNSDPDIDVEEEWLSTYEAWFPYIVTDATVLNQTSGGQEQPATNAGDKSHIAQQNNAGLDDLIEDGGADSNRSELMAQIVTNIFLESRTDLYNIVNRFSTKIAMHFATMEDYSLASAEALGQFFAESLKSAASQIDNISTVAMRSYYMQLENIGIEHAAGSVTDPFGKKLQENLSDIEYEAMGELRSLVEILEARVALPTIGAQLAVQNDIYKKVAAEQFAKAQADASRERDATWWDDLKASGSEFAKDFAVNFEKEFDKALDKAFDQAMGDIGVHVSEGLSSIAGKAGEAVGKQLNKLLDKQIMDRLQGMAADKSAAILDKVPNLLKNQTLKQLGIDEDEELGVAALKVAIRKMNPSGHDFSTVQVRQPGRLSAEEQRFVANRTPKVRAALSEHFGIDKDLKIGLCSSGGGNRAMLASLGFFLGAEEIGLFDASMYNAGLSGSTWTISPWSYFKATKNMSLSDFKDQLVGRLDSSVAAVAGIGGPPMLGSDVLTDFSMNIAKRFAYGQEITTIDAYGGLIGNYTLLPAGAKRLKATWSSIAGEVEKGDMPYPIGSAVSLKEKKVGQSSQYYWYEIGPFEAGSDAIGYVPTWAFGSKFEAGKPVDSYEGAAPEYPLSYYEGVYGSAFAASANEVLDQALPKPSFTVLGKKFALPIDVWIQKSMNDKVKDSRLYPASFHNFARNLSGSPIKDEEQIELYDGAMNFNYPLPLIMRPARGVDVVVICDASQDVASMKAAQIHFERNNIKFPNVKNLTKDDILSRHMTVFNDPRGSSYDNKIITILYFPLTKNVTFDESFDPVDCTSNGPCKTFNFQYTKEQAEKVVGLSHANVIEMKDEIKSVLQALARRK